MAFLFHRGTWVKDKITGFAGCITARSDHITSCNNYLVQPEIDKDGKHIDGHWIDEHRLEIDNSKQQVRLDRTAEQPPG